MLSIGWNIHSVEPCFRCRLCVVEEQQIGGNGSIGAEHRAGQSDNGMQIKLANELFLDVYLGVVQTKQKAVRHDNGGSAVLLQAVQDDRHKQVGCFRTCQVVGEEALNRLVLMPTIGRIHQYHIKLIIIRIVQQIVFQRVHVIDVRDFNIMQQHIGYAQQIGKRLFFNSVNAIIQLLLSGGVRYLLGELSKPRGDKSTGATGEICHLFAQLRLYHQCHKLGDCSRRIEFTGRTSRLQLPQNLLIDKTESMAFLHIVKLNLVSDINDLTKINAVLHIVVSILEGGLDNGFLNWSIGCHLDTFIENRITIFHIIAFQNREQGIVDKIKELISSHSMTATISFRPISPSKVFGNDGFIIILIQLPIIFFCVIDFEKKHPYHLLNSLRIAVDTSVHTHYISNSFYKT